MCFFTDAPKQKSHPTCTVAAMLSRRWTPSTTIEVKSFLSILKEVCHKFTDSIVDRSENGTFDESNNGKEEEALIRSSDGNLEGISDS